jgi:cysteine synthase A
MFRTAVRRFAATALRPAETLTQLEAPQLHGIEISKAQRIAHDGFIDGALAPVSCLLSRG